MASVPQEWRHPLDQPDTVDQKPRIASPLFSRRNVLRAGVGAVLAGAALSVSRSERVQEIIGDMHRDINISTADKSWLGKPVILREPLPEFPGCEVQITMEHSLPPSAIGFDEDGMPAQVGKVEPMCLINIMRPDAPVNQKVVHSLGTISGAKSPQHLLNESLDSAVLPSIERIAGEHGEGNNLRSVADMVEYAQKNRKTLTGQERQEILQQVLRHWLLAQEQQKSGRAAGNSLTSFE